MEEGKRLPKNKATVKNRKAGKKGKGSKRTVIFDRVSEDSLQISPSTFINVDEIGDGELGESGEKKTFLRLDGTFGSLQPFHKQHIEKEPAGLLADTCVDFLASIILRPSEIMKDAMIMPLRTYRCIDNSEDHVSRIVNASRFVFDHKIPHLVTTGSRRWTMK